MLLQIPDVLDARQLAEARRLLADAPWSDGRDSAGSQAAQVKRNQQLPHDCAAARHVRDAVIGAVEREPLFLSAALPRRLFTPRINRYGGDTPAMANMSTTRFGSAPMTVNAYAPISPARYSSASPTPTRAANC